MCNEKTSSILEYLELLDNGFTAKIPLKKNDHEDNSAW